MDRAPAPKKGPGGRSADLRADPRRHGDFVWRTLQRQGVHPADLDDALQEVFLVAHRRQEAFDPERGQLTTWLFGICIKVAWALRRRRARTSGALPELVDHDTPEAACGRSQRARLLSAALERLSPEQRATFVLYELEGQSCADIAELSGVPLGTVYSRLHGARASLRAALEKAQGVVGASVRGHRPPAWKPTGELP